MPWVPGRLQLADFRIAGPALQWIPASPGLLPRYPRESETPRQLSAIPIGDPAPVQIHHRFRLETLDAAPLALLLPRTDGQLRVHVNGVRQVEALPRTAQGNAPSDPRKRLWVIPKDHLHSGENRIDVLVKAAVLRPLRGPIYLGPQASLTPIVEWGQWLTTTGQLLLLALSALAVALNLFAFSVRAGSVHLPIAALFAAVGTHSFLANAQAELGRFWQIAEQLAVAAMLMGIVAIAKEATSAPGSGRRRIEVALSMLAVAMAIGAVLTRWLGGESAVLIAAGAVVVAGLCLAWIARAALPAGIALARHRPIVLGCIIGPATIAGGIAVIGGTGINLAGPPFAAEISLSVSLAVLAAIAGSFGASAAGRRMFAIARARIDQGFVIRQQKAKLDAATQALNEVSREAAILEERHRMARDVHDGIGGQLASLIAQVRLRRVSMTDVERALMGGLSELRLLVDSLDLVGEKLGDVCATLLGRLRQQNATAGVRLEWHQSGDLGVEVRDPRWILNLYRLVQEAITNAVRHSGGDRIAVTIARLDENMLSVRIEDNGTSFDAANGSAGRGLTNMTHRAREMGGMIEFGTSAQHGGASVRVDLPIPRRSSGVEG